MNIKMKILSWVPRTRTFLVNVYTDKLEQGMGPIWAARAAELLTSRHASSPEEALVRAQQIDRPGVVSSITLFNDPLPAGDVLYKLLLERAIGGGGWLAHLEKCADAPEDMADEVGVAKDGTVTVDGDGKPVYTILP